MKVFSKLSDKAENNESKESKNFKDLNMSQLLKSKVETVSNVTSGWRNSNKELLRLKLSNLQTEFNEQRENGADLLLLFPEEIWTMILGYVTSGSDLHNCSKTCQLFERLVMSGKSKTEILFGMIFPIVVKHLTKWNILNCRLVCKQWMSDIDTFLENYFDYKSPSKDIIEQIRSVQFIPNEMGSYKFEYKVNCPFDSENMNFQPESDLFVHFHHQRELDYSGKNPIIGRTLGIFVDNCCCIDSDFFAELGQILDRFGNHIWNLGLYAVGMVEPVSPANAYNICRQSLLKCKSLKRMSIFGWNHLNSDWSNCFEEVIKSNPLLPEHNCLESLAFYTPNPKFLLIQDKLVTKFSTQLKSLYVHYWNKNLYSNLSWETLEVLSITKQNTDILTNLRQITATNLKKFTIFLGEGSSNLEELFQTINHFQNLKELYLKPPEKVAGFCDDEIIKLSPELISKTLITSIGISSYGAFFNYNFLICFPFVKTLIIGNPDSVYSMSYFDDSEIFQSDIDDDENEERLENNADEGISPTEENNGELLEAEAIAESDGNSKNRDYHNNLNKDCVAISKEFVQISKYFRRHTAKHKDGMPVWEVLPSLNLVQTWGNHTRRRYTWETKEDKRKYLNLCWKLVQKKVELDEEEYCYEEAEARRGRLLRWSVERDSLEHNIFSMIFQYLERKDILTCRLASKKWRYQIDQALEKYGIVDEYKKRPVYSFEGMNLARTLSLFEYKFGIPRDPNSIGHDNVFEDMQIYRRNPFLGRRVVFTLKSHEKRFYTGPKSELNRFLKSFGNYIWYFTLSGSKNISNKLAPYEYYTIIVRILNNCKNLRSLFLSDIELDWAPNIWDLTHLIPTDSILAIQKLEFWTSLTVKSNNFQALLITFQILVDQVQTITRLELASWADHNIYHWRWPNLRVLILSAPDSDEWLEKLLKFEAPKLETLGVRLDGERKIIQILISLTKHFKNIQKLELTIANEFSGLKSFEVIDSFRDMKIISESLIDIEATDLYHLPPDTFNTLVSSKSLVNMEIIIPHKFSLCFDFLIQFPYLKRLCIRYGDDDNCEASESNLKVNTGNHDGNIVGSNTPKMWANDFIEIVKYIDKNGSNQDIYGTIYKSNIWTKLPLLVFLEIKRDSPESQNSTEYVPNVYTRELYENFHKIVEKDELF